MRTESYKFNFACTQCKHRNDFEACLPEGTLSILGADNATWKFVCTKCNAKCFIGIGSQGQISKHKTTHKQGKLF